MITRRNILKGAAAATAGYIAGTVATVFWPREARALGWPFRKGLTTDDLTRYHQPPRLYHHYPADQLTGYADHALNIDNDHLDLRAGGIEHFDEHLMTDIKGQLPRLVYDADCEVCRELAG